MYAAVEPLVSLEDDLQSGGAAYADHLAVLLFLDGRVRSLTLYLPEHFDFERCRFLERGSRSCGLISNYYHDRFSAVMGVRTMDHLREVRDAGARIVVVPGFLQRNIPVGQCERLIALTFGKGAQPEDGGTKHCWSHSSAVEKVHISLASL